MLAAMVRPRVRNVALLATALASAQLAWACRAPTQITLEITTDVACDRLRGTSIYGASGERPPSEPITTTTQCTAGSPTSSIGSLVVTPAGDKGGRAAIAVVAGLDRPSESCASAGYKGCIIARRRLSFVPHEPLSLPIALDRACVDVPCDETQTCVASRCVSAEVDPRDPCRDGLCGAGVGAGPSAPDATPPTAAAPLVVDTSGLLVLGLAASPSTLFYVKAQTHAYVVEAVPLSDLARTPTLFEAMPVGAKVGGIAYNESPPTLGVAGAFFEADPTIIAYAGTIYAVSGASSAGLKSQFIGSAAGVGIVSLSNQNWLVAEPDFGLLVWTASNGTSSGVVARGTFTGYLDRFGSEGSVFAAVSGGVAEIALNTAGDNFVRPAGNVFPKLGSLSASAGDTLGVAVSAGHVYVSTKSQQLFAIRRSDGATQPLPFTVPLPNDLLYRPLTTGAVGELYVAGAQGIYRIPALD